MSVMFEVYYTAPADMAREAAILQEVSRLGGRLNFREEPSAGDVSQAVVLTYEFEDRQAAERAASVLRSVGEHVEGPCDYG